MGGPVRYGLVLVVLAAAGAVWGLTRSSVRRPSASPESTERRQASTLVTRTPVPAAPGAKQVRAGEFPAPVGERESLAAARNFEVLGTVVGPDGLPVAGAEITVFEGPLHVPGLRAAPALLTTRVSAADGRFRCSVPTDQERFGVRVRAAGFVSKSRDQSPGVDVPFELAPGVRVRGRILGEKAAEARLYFFARATGTTVRVDDGQGRYAAEEVPLGLSARFEVVPSDAAPFFFELEPARPGELVHDIELGRARRLAGRVLDALDGTPIAGAELSMYSSKGPGRLAETDARGEFELALAGPYLAVLDSSEDGALFQLDVRAPGYFACSVPLTLLARGQAVELLPGARVTGRVLDAEGRPAHGARLAFHGRLWIQDERYESLRLEAPEPAMSDERGRFEFACVPWGSDEAVLEVVHAGTRAWFGNIAPRDPRAREPLELCLPRGRSLAGTLVWEDADYLRLGPSALLAGETPLPAPAGVAVWLRVPGETAYLAATSDERGRFVFENRPAGVLEISLAGAEPSWMRVPEAMEQLQGLPVPPPRRNVRGVLYGSDGAPLTGQEILLLLHRRTSGRGYRESTRTDERGVFEFTPTAFSGLAWRLVVERAGLAFEREAAAVVDWTLPPLVPVELHLANAEAIERWGLEWIGPRPGDAGRVPGAFRFVDGRFVTPLPVGELELFGHGPRGRVLHALVTIRAAEEQSLELTVR